MSDHIIYVDESGDHGLKAIDTQYPVFVLAFCIFEQHQYVHEVTPAVQSFKFRHFGHDMVILRGRDIARGLGEFAFLQTSAELRREFMNDITGVIAAAPFTVIASVIDKRKLATQYAKPSNPYDLSMAFCLERAAMHLHPKKDVTVVFESRGKEEDSNAELEFRRVCDGANHLGEKLPFLPIFASKHVNSTGLQLADLVARPIGLKVLRPEQTNRPYEVIREKIRRNPKNGKPEGWGIKRFP